MRRTGRSTDDSPPVVYADPDAIAELGQLRRRELQVFSDRLGRVEERSHGQAWMTAAVTLASVGLGALVAGIPLLSSTASWDNWVKPVYAVSVGLALLVAAVCWLAGRSVKRERADSVSDIKGDLDKLLSGYERKPISQQALAEAIVPFLQRMRAEARENHRLISEVKQRAEYWRWTEAPTPETKEWKKNSSILEADTEHQELYEAGQRAARRVDGLMTTRSVRMLTRARKVKPGDGLDETLHALEEFERLLTAEVDRALG